LRETIPSDGGGGSRNAVKLFYWNLSYDAPGSAKHGGPEIHGHHL
jgi:hypothetical protein